MTRLINIERVSDNTDDACNEHDWGRLWVGTMGRKGGRSHTCAFIFEFTSPDEQLRRRKGPDGAWVNFQVDLNVHPLEETEAPSRLGN